MLPGRARRERAAADAADRGVEDGRARLERGERVREAGVARVVQVDADWACRASTASPTSCVDLARDARRRSCRRGRSRRRRRRRARSASSSTRAGSTAPSNGQPNATPIVTVARMPSARARATMRVAAASDSSGEAFWLRWLKRLGRGEGEVHLVEPGRERAGRSPLVQHEARVDDPGAPVDRRRRPPPRPPSAGRGRG